MRATGRADLESRRHALGSTPGLCGVQALATAILLAVAATPSPAPAEETAPLRSLTVAIFDLQEFPALAPRPPPEFRHPAWRTTFGSERATQPRFEAGAVSGPLAALAGVDAVLIQGLQAAAPLRRLFPPREWRLIVSRRVLSATDPVGFRTVRRNLPPTTAIAVKARPDLRVTARTLALNLEASAENDQEAAATAIRLDLGGRAVWLASIALPASCNVEDPPCPALAALDAWRKQKLDGGEPTLIGGRMSAEAPPAARMEAANAENAAPAPSACASHTIESDLAWERVASGGTEVSARSEGCISIIRLSH